MRAIRLLKLNEYISDEKRFSSNSFRNSSDGSGISIISVDCIIQSGTQICVHLQTYYSNNGNEIIFWEFDTNQTSNSYNLIQCQGTTGDPYHYNLTDLSNGGARRFFKANCPDLSSIKMCNSNGQVENMSSSI